MNKNHHVKTNVDVGNKAFQRNNEKFVPRRHIVFPKELFIELKLSKRQILKVRGWERAGHSIFPMWFTSCERVLFIDEELFNEWTKRKAPLGPIGPKVTQTKRSCRRLSKDPGAAADSNATASEVK